MIDKLSLPYRPCVGILMFNTDGLVFVGRRLDTPDAWQMPQGGIDQGEAPSVAALRELSEETGTAAATIIAETAGWLTYDLPDELIGKVWKGRWRGQRQKWFAGRFDGTDSDINLNTGQPEFDAWRWVPLADLPNLIVPFKLALYRDVVRELGPAVAAATARKN